MSLSQSFRTTRAVVSALCCCLALACALPAPASEAPIRSFDVPAGTANDTLKRFAQQAGREIMFPSGPLNEQRTNAVKGDLSVADALDRLLAGTELAAQVDPKSGAIVVTRAPVPNAERAIAKTSDRPESPKKDEEGRIELPSFEVMGSKLLNMDIRRTRDDAQPYAIFEREILEQSGATNLEDFLKSRLTMNTQGATQSQAASTFGGTSEINLRGLGANQTLILIDGRRAAPVFGPSILPRQADLNGIPLGAIERVEVLSTTASGIYGGAATGGVINIVLRRDYAGVELRTSYQDAFASNGATRRADLSAGLTLEGGRTNLLVSATWSETNDLVAQDRDLLASGRATILANNPNFFLTGATPPLGRTPNIRSVNGSPLFGAGTPNFTHVPEGYVGGGLAPLAPNAGRYNFALAETAQSGGARRSLINAPRTFSANLTARRQFSPIVQGFLEFAASGNSGHFLTSNLGSTFTVNATAPNNPFGQAVRVTVPISQGDHPLITHNDTKRLVIGTIVDLSHEWQACLDYSWQRTSGEVEARAFFAGTESAFVADGRLDVLRDLRAAPVDFSPHFGLISFGPRDADAHSGNLRFSGPVGRLPAGAPMVSAVFEYRDERIGDSNQNSTIPAFAFLIPSRSQSTGSVYVETKLPLISAEQAWLGLRELDLQLAARRDDYRVNGAPSTVPLTSTAPLDRRTNRTHSTNPTIGLRLKPLQDIILRASHGTGFLPPNVGQLSPNAPTTSSTTLGDPRRGNTPIGSYVSFGGGNAQLRPEESESWSGGAVLTPRWLPGLRLALDWTRIEKTDNINALPSLQLIVDNEAILPGRVTRGAKLPGDPAGWAGPITQLDLTAVNLSSATVEAWDATADYVVETRTFGQFAVYAQATWQTHYITQVAPTTPAIENIGIGAANPLKFKANAGLTWKWRRWTAGWAAQRYDSYQVAANPTTTGATTVANQGALRVPAQTFHDVYISHRWRPEARGATSRILGGLEVRVAVRNVLDTAPAFNAATGPDRYYNLFADPRGALYELMVKKVF